MSCGCSRITHHLNDKFGVSSSSSKFMVSSSFLINKPQFIIHKLQSSRNPTRKRRDTNFSSCFSNVGPFICCLQSNPLPILSQKDNDCEMSSERLPSISGGVVALGKFDALHVGHRELAIQASKVGTPFLLSFVGMAEVLGWAPRAPIVATCDRGRVLSSWAPFCRNITPKELQVGFAGVRHLTPRQFVEKLSKELGVRGVVAGENYRFGYKAAGDASELVRLCEEYGIQAYIISSVMDKNRVLDNSYPPDKKEIGQVSSTRVRYALSKGDMYYVSELLGRSHRLILSTENKEDFFGPKNQLSAPRSSLLNLPPKEGLYENCSLVVSEEDQVSCKMLIDSTSIRVELDEKARYVRNVIKDLDHLAIEFQGQKI